MTVPSKVHPALIHRLRTIVHKFIQHGADRVELIEDEGKQFIKVDGKKIGRSLQQYAGMDESCTAWSLGFGLADFGELVLILETQLNLKGFSRKEMLALAEFVPEDKRPKWLEIW